MTSRLSWITVCPEISIDIQDELLRRRASHERMSRQIAEREAAGLCFSCGQDHPPERGVYYEEYSAEINVDADAYRRERRFTLIGWGVAAILFVTGLFIHSGAMAADWQRHGAAAQQCNKLLMGRSQGQIPEYCLNAFQNMQQKLNKEDAQKLESANGDETASQRQCMPLLVMYGGAADSSISGLVENYSRKLKAELAIARVLYFSHTDEERYKSVESIREHLKKYSESPLVLVGHSYGGDAAYRIAKNVSNKVRLLVTIDPVGGIAFPSFLKFSEFRRQLSKPSSVKDWINIVVHDPPGAFRCILMLGFLWDMSNCIADAGAQWGIQDHAENKTFRGDHGEFSKMYQEIAEAYVTAALESCRQTG